MITNICTRELWVVATDKKIYFDSFKELKDYILNSFNKLALSYTPPLSELWEYVLNNKFGARDWVDGIHENGYDTTANGYIYQYTGEKTHHDCSVRVFGTRAGGDAYYASDGGIYIEFLENSIVNKNRRLEEIRVEVENLSLEKTRIEASL